MKLTGAQALIKSLEMEQVEIMFGLPGGAILPVYDPLIDSSIRHILVRHEQGAGHMASGYAHATGRPGVAMVTSGPAATNIVTPLCDAYMDSIPIVVITGQVAYSVIGTDAFQEADTVGITMPVTKHNWLISDAQDIPRVVREAFHVATTGRPGPVLVDVPKDIANQTMDWYWPEKIDLPGYKPNVKGHPRQIKDAARLINEAGNYTAVTAMQKADLLITLGARFDDRVTGKVSTFAPDAKVIHVDIDPAELGKVRHADVPIVGDVRTVIEEMIKALKSERAKNDPPDLAPWMATLRDWQERYPLKYTQEEGGPLKPQFVIERLRDNTPDDCILVAGVGQHQMWASQLWKFKQPNTWVNSGGLGTMGYAVPAAVGAKVGRPDRMVWAIDGDGCFQMTAQELVTAASERIPVKIAILNNAYLGMVRQWQELFYEERYSEVYLSPDLPDYVKWAEAMGCVGMRVDTADDVVATIEKANAIDDRPVVIDFRTDWREKVYPMVAAGSSNDDIILGPEFGEGGR